MEQVNYNLPVLELFRWNDFIRRAGNEIFEKTINAALRYNGEEPIGKRFTALDEKRETLLVYNIIVGTQLFLNTPNIPDIEERNRVYFLGKQFADGELKNQL